MNAAPVAAPDTPALPVLGRIGPEAGREAIIAHIREGARLIRRRDISMINAAGLGHVGGEFSVIDILATLYLHVLEISADHLDDPERDRLILSKGHAAGALYATLAAAGLLDPVALDTFLQPLSKLNGHPDRTKVRGVEANTGPLGHGLPIAVGTALAGKLDGSRRRTFVVLGDGELQEGSNWEAMMAAAHHRLERLTAIVDRNRLQQGARVADTNELEPLADKIRAFGWQPVEVDGHDHGALLDVLTRAPADGKPTFVIAHTVKGHPITFMSDEVAWHHKVPDADQVATALAELETE
ncbi:MULTISPECIES: transketolase [Micromonosporaceae]|uniref:transketolase n=1 Tax=Micromonosporaceae TaxID=28056 RepID=UPI00249BDD1D|nr:transketolase [Solwaraspora sp. WMMD937]WFE21794.1 transketolase [Solwaraspora sp. WMMD937]